MGWGWGALYHSLRLPVGHGRVGLDGGTFPQQVCADRVDACGEAGVSVSPRATLPPALGGCTPALTWQVFADNVSGFHRAGHGGMHDSVKLQPQAGQPETS